jgi:predicted RNA-binding Zn ribbon-like protein
MASHDPAPAELELVRGFVNSWNRLRDHEELATPADLRAWLAERGLLGGGEDVGAGDHRRALEVREALRAALMTNAGLELDPAAGSALEAAARRARLGVRFDEHGHARTEPLAGGVDGALGRLLAIVAAAQADGTWPRLKVCLADDCQWAFYDRSRNRSAVWCDMRVCGNRQKVRSYRERHLPRALEG